MTSTGQIQEHFYIDGGFGPIQTSEKLDLDIQPVTIFIGPQGTGKSLVSQLLYFLEIEMASRQLVCNFTQYAWEDLNSGTL